MGISIGTSIDYLVAGLPAAALAVDPAAVVVDSIPTVTSESMIVIGRQAEDQAIGGFGSQMIVALGAGRSQEDYSIPGWVECYRPGPQSKPARDAAIALFDVVAQLVAADRSLGGALQQGRIAQISDVTIIQTDIDENGAVGDMRNTRITFSIHCQNHYIP